MRRATLLLIAAFGLVTSVAAQNPWRASYFPYLIGGPNDGLMLVGRYQYARQAEYLLEGREKISPLVYDGIFSAVAGVSGVGSRFLALRFQAPGLVTGWRFAADLLAQREGRFGFYGLGWDDEPYLSSPSDDAGFNRVHRTRYLARGEVTRRLAGPLRLAGAATLQHTRFTPLDGPTLFGPVQYRNTDAVFRGALVLDTRDREFTPSNGVLAEAGLFAGTGGIDTNVQDAAPRAAYTGGYLNLRGYVSPREGTVIAARVAARGLSRGAPFSAKYELNGWERDLTALGGPETHRGFVRGRFGGNNVILGSLEVRHDLLSVGDFGAITLIGFVDGGRVFEGRSLKLTLDGWAYGGGGGIGLRILRSAILTMNFAGSRDGFTFSMGTGWAF